MIVLFTVEYLNMDIKGRRKLHPGSNSGMEENATKMETHHKKTDVFIFGWKFNTVILATHINIFLYSTCFWIQTGTLPYLTKKLGVDPVSFGYLQTTFAVVQLAGGPLYGRFGDLYGGRAAMMLAFSSAAILYFILGMADSFLLLFLSRLPSIFMHAMQGKSDSGVFSIKKILALIAAPGALFLLIIRAAEGIPIGIFQSMFSVVAMDTFKLPAEQNGYLMSYIGILTMLVQGLGVGILTKKFSENDIMKWSAFLLIWAYLALAFITDIFQFCIVIAPLVVGLASSNIVISSALTKTVTDVDTGAMLGLNMAVNSLIRSLSPTVGGYLLKNFGFSSFGYLGFIMLLIVTVVLFIKVRN
ncbi:hypothetical protein KUTeg_000429 [Tegillarca granosa]|uniref:Major facilitator superfamily (MFS) profile domain-containing protein n=1 Tax=Tegillarca granosa TaxID=220873 RepID=A0ABQ9G1V4_TEGGR|nr:hypothetical protein KUTeg_000429 [Tegillarca granosa]